MKTYQTAALLILSLGAVALSGCAHTTYAYAPPPPSVQQVPGIVQLGDRNGFQTGRSDGIRDAYNGFVFAPERTRAFRDTPGYDPGLGPFGTYRRAFRDAYRRGYERGYYHR